MHRIPVQSSNIEEVGYDPQLSTLEVEFNSGDVYQYLDVPENVYRSFIAASSLGQFLDENIRYNYRYQKIS